MALGHPVWRGLAHLLCALPLGWLAVRFGLDGLGANPIEAAVRFLGDWGLRMLLIALAVTPLRVWAKLPVLAKYRRMVGLWAFAYALLHLAAYVVLDQFFDWDNILREIVKHKFITAGMAAFLLLLPLAITSTQGMIRRLGGLRWRRLHRAVFLAAPLAVLHYGWMVKADIRQPLLYGAILALLLAARLIKAKVAVARADS